MGELFLRKVILEIIPQNGQTVIIDKLRINFNIEKTSTSTPNSAEIEVYNLAETTRNLIAAKGTKVKLSIGYEGLNPQGFFGTGIGTTSNVDLVYFGDVRKFIVNVQKPDVISRIECGDGLNKYSNARINKSYGRGVKLEQIITDLEQAMGLPIIRRDKKLTKVFAGGVTLSGLVRDYLDKICESNGLEWSIQDNQIRIIEKDFFTKTQGIILLTPETGLIKSPNSTKDGIEFESLIQPNLKIGSIVKIESKYLTGFFKIRKINHAGDSQEGDFLTKCECRTK